MRLLVAIAVTCCLETVSVADGQRQVFPYKALINANEVYVRSGPGQSYYPTDKLKIGQQVEVYRHDPGGWCAVRPADGSFSWVAARYLQAAENNLAVVAEDHVAARVGSRFSDVRDTIQVRLRKGEVVEVLEGNPGTGSGAWCKIAPPAGEFRWVSGKYVDTEYPHDGLRRRRPEGAVAAEAETPPPAAEVAEAARTARRRLSPEEFQAELDAVEVELSTMVVEEPTVWSFEPLRLRAESLLDQAETALERGRARVLLNKIARFADIKHRYGALAALREETDRSHRQLAGGALPLRTSAKLTEPPSRFDGTGRLTEVYSPKIGAPRYALVDQRGEVRCYVTPAPGVNLRSYVGQQVGINGTRGYMPEQRANHLMARYVSAVEDRTLR